VIKQIKNRDLKVIKSTDAKIYFKHIVTGKCWALPRPTDLCGYKTDEKFLRAILTTLSEEDNEKEKM